MISQRQSSFHLRYFPRTTTTDELADGRPRFSGSLPHHVGGHDVDDRRVRHGRSHLNRLGRPVLLPHRRLHLPDHRPLVLERHRLAEDRIG